MKILLVILALFVGLVFTVPVYSAPYIYFNWDAQGETNEIKIILLGLPDSPIEAEVTKIPNPNDPNDDTYYKAEYDLENLPDGEYVLTGKIRNLWGQESPESPPAPFVKRAPGGVLGVHLDF